MEIAKKIVASKTARTDVRYEHFCPELALARFVAEAQVSRVRGYAYVQKRGGESVDISEFFLIG